MTNHAAGFAAGSAARAPQLPARAGLGLKSEHYQAILDSSADEVDVRQRLLGFELGACELALGFFGEAVVLLLHDERGALTGGEFVQLGRALAHR